MHTHMCHLESGNLKVMAFCKVVLGELGLGINKILLRMWSKEQHMFLYDGGGGMCMCVWVCMRVFVCMHKNIKRNSKVDFGKQRP